MKQLFEIDLHDYDESDTVFRRPSARAIIFDDVGKIALVYSKKENYYKFPGGGIHDDEDRVSALIRGRSRSDCDSGNNRRIWKCVAQTEKQC